MSTSNDYDNGKFQYYDKMFFVKNQRMTTHLLGKCEKIPDIIVQHQLLPKEKRCYKANKYEVFCCNTYAFHHDYFKISDSTNENASGKRGDVTHH